MMRLFPTGDGLDACVPVTRRLRLNGQSTSIRLERPFWEMLVRMAMRRGLTTPAYVSQLQSELIESRGETGNFTSFLRCACLLHAQSEPRSATALAAE